MLFITMLLVAILGGIFIGYMIGCCVLDKWVNDGSDEVNNIK